MALGASWRAFIWLLDSLTTCWSMAVNPGQTDVSSNKLCTAGPLGIAKRVRIHVSSRLQLLMLAAGWHLAMAYAPEHNSCKLGLDAMSRIPLLFLSLCHLQKLFPHITFHASHTGHDAETAYFYLHYMYTPVIQILRIQGPHLKPKRFPQDAEARCISTESQSCVSPASSLSLNWHSGPQPTKPPIPPPPP